MYDVIVLFDGYSKDHEGKTVAGCTCTLLKGDDNDHIIIDTMTPWDGQKLKNKLEEYEVKCEDIKYVICTHGHSDHIGCNYLFPNIKKLIVGFDISYMNTYDDHDFRGGHSYVINDSVEVVPTPGHTLQDVSIVVKTKNSEIVAITGDLFEREEDLLDDKIWKSVGYDHELQLTNRTKILRRVDWIVPGHGRMFKVPDIYKM